MTDKPVIDKFLHAIETADIPGCDAWSADATLDATVPNWRLHAAGADAIRAEYARWFADPARFDELRRYPVEGGSAEVVDVDVEYSPWSTQAEMVQRGEQRGADVDIEGADILVAGGRGLGKPEGFELAEELARAFGGNSAVAATRAVVDAGWYPYAAQIGQTGKTVAPKLYLAAGISGAIQHKVGMQSSENIVAINKDANAPIFEFCDFGVVGDLFQIVPELTKLVKERKGTA